MRTVAWCWWTRRRGRERRSRFTSPPPGGKRKRHEPAAIDSGRRRRDGDPGRAPDPVERGRVRRHHRSGWEGGAGSAERKPARHRAHGHQDAGRLGHQILAAVRDQDPETPVILMTAQASLQSAIQAVNQGAFYYIQKPFSNDDLVAICRRAAEQRLLKA